MKISAIVLIVGAILAVGYFGLVAGRGEPTQTMPAPARDDVTLRSTTAGEVVGFVGRFGARVWLGLPYAAPPTGDLRWRAPRPPAAWEGTREALAVSDVCPQKPSMLTADRDPDAVVTGSEDCLYLNVWSPPDADDLPVMLWIHGGGNSIGDGGSYVGARLATSEQVVVVTINYRLGPLGWFAHPALATGGPADASGNYGTLDIVRALEWTRDNIAAFGGDPNNVTLFGESAGAFDTLAMMASPLAQGLFHRAISQSGGFNVTPMARAANYAAEGGHPYSAREVVNRLLIADGTVTDDAAARAYQNDMSAAQVREYLYSKTPEDLFALWDGGGTGMIDTPDTIGDGHVIPAMSAEEIFADTANHNVVPVILGTNRDEPALFMARDPEHVRNILWVFPRLKDEANYRRIVKYGGQAWKARGVDELAELMTRAGNKQVYAYRFDWDELGSRGGYDLSKAIGAAHIIEIPFVFGEFENFSFAYLYEGATNTEPLSRSIRSYWSQFAYQGEPGRGREGDLPAWLGWGTDGQTSLVLDSDSDGGIRMIDERVTRESVVQALATDPEVPDQQARCALYRNTFWGDAFDAQEYRTLGDGGCALPEAEAETLSAR